ncbi:MAG TPA: hypothetical protein PLO55_12065, partial [Thermotogota bacterium]|nr:hypothetical protein [Thermotogota bacterium]
PTKRAVLPICSGKAYVIVSGIVNIAFTRFVCVYWIITYAFAHHSTIRSGACYMTALERPTLVGLPYLLVSYRAPIIAT